MRGWVTWTPQVPPNLNQPTTLWRGQQLSPFSQITALLCYSTRIHTFSNTSSVIQKEFMQERKFKCSYTLCYKFTCLHSAISCVWSAFSLLYSSIIFWRSASIPSCTVKLHKEPGTLKKENEHFTINFNTSDLFTSSALKNCLINITKYWNKWSPSRFWMHFYMYWYTCIFFGRIATFYKRRKRKRKPPQFFSHQYLWKWKQCKKISITKIKCFRITRKSLKQLFKHMH